MVASFMRRMGGNGLLASRNSESPELRVHDPIATLYGCLFHAEGGGDHAESCAKLVAESLHVVREAAKGRLGLHKLAAALYDLSGDGGAKATPRREGSVQQARG